MAFGGIFRKAGFRWIFPIGTLPIPYHPLVGLLFILGPPLWIAWLGISAIIDTGGAVRWWQPLAAAFLLGIPMSIPIVAWAMMAFRAPLAQGALFAGSMLLLAIEVATDRTSLWWAVLPAAFVLLYAVQRIGGQRALARLETAAQSWTPIDPGDMTVVVTDEKHSGEKARYLLKRCDIARIASVPGPPLRGLRKAQQRMLHRLSPAVARRMDDIVTGHMPPGCRRDEMMADGWSIPAPTNAEPVLVRPIGDDVVVGLTVDTIAYRSPLWMVRGKLRRLRVYGSGIDRQLVCGSASSASRWPIFVFFHWTAIFGGQSEWCVGFLRDRTVQLGPEAYGYQLLPHAFIARPEAGGRTDESLFDDASDSAATAKASVADVATAALVSQRHRLAEWRWATLSREGTRLDKAVFERLFDPHGTRDLDDARTLLAGLGDAKEGRRAFEAHLLASMIASLPEPLFAASETELADILNSRILAGKWLITPELDLKDVPKNCPRFGSYGGFGLIDAVPELYDRFAALGPQRAKFVDDLRRSVPSEADNAASARRRPSEPPPRDPGSPQPITIHRKMRR